MMNPILLAFNLNPYVSAFPVSTFFTRLGHILAGVNQINTFRGTTIQNRANTLAADYTSSDQSEIDSLYADTLNFQNLMSGRLGQLQSMAQSVLIDMVNETAPQSSKSLSVALAYLVQQMQYAGQTVKRCNVSASWAAGPSNVGNAVLVPTTLSPIGLPYEYAFAESVAATCTADAQSGNATAGQETLQFKGQFAVSDPLNWLFPAGSGATATVGAVSASAYQQGGTRNQLNNGDFESTWTGNVPLGWTVDLGTPGTQILKGTTLTYDGAASLAFVGDSATLTSVYQRFGSASGTTVTPSPLDVMAVNLWIAATGLPASGVLEVSLTDGLGNYLEDAQGVNCAFTKSLAGLTTAWAPVNGVFRTPRVLPSVFRLRIRLTTALPTGATLYIDRVAAARPVSLYTGGPRVAVFSGNENLILNDAYTLTVANDFGGLIQTGMNKLMGMRSLGLILPSTTGTPTISDSLIV